VIFAKFDTKLMTCRRAKSSKWKCAHTVVTKWNGNAHCRDQMKWKMRNTLLWPNEMEMRTLLWPNVEGFFFGALFETSWYSLSTSIYTCMIKRTKTSLGHTRYSHWHGIHFDNIKNHSLCCTYLLVSAWTCYCQ
jgi:hypothetical protein